MQSGGFLFSACPSPHQLAPFSSLCYIPFVETKRDAPILKVTGDRVEGIIDEVASELPIRLVLNNEPLVTLLCTPAELEELAVGFLLSEGILRDKASIHKLEVEIVERPKAEPPAAPVFVPQPAATPVWDWPDRRNWRQVR